MTGGDISLRISETDSVPALPLSSSSCLLSHGDVTSSASPFYPFLKLLLLLFSILPLTTLTPMLAPILLNSLTRVGFSLSIHLSPPPLPPLPPLFHLSSFLISHYPSCFQRCPLTCISPYSSKSFLNNLSPCSVLCADY